MKLSYQKKLLEAGLDEVGRGCLAGPVYAAAVILPWDYHSSILNDSKKLSKKNREKLAIEIKKEALSFGIGFCSAQEIDEINILNASFLAMHKALKKLKQQPGFLAVDGNRFKVYEEVPFQCCVKGDAHYLNIAAASVLAKTERDSFMEELHAEYPQYDWVNNKGYPTKKHREGILKTGISPYHRRSFQLISPQLKLNI